MDATIAPLTIHPLPPERLPDFLAFFDGPAFADNPKWGSCYCQYLYVDHSKENWHQRSLDENRSAACSKIGCGEMQGYLAYQDGKVIGWCSAAPRPLMTAFDDQPEVDATHIGQIGCFVVAKAFRRQGLASALLQAACAGLQAQGMRRIQATPRAEAGDDGAATDGAATDGSAHFGPLSMYLAAGFQVMRPDSDGLLIVERHLPVNEQATALTPE
mgnify:CR=1 FL=1